VTVQFLGEGTVSYVMMNMDSPRNRLRNIGQIRIYIYLQTDTLLVDSAHV
jgi:hypothetical protein